MSGNRSCASASSSSAAAWSPLSRYRSASKYHSQADGRVDARDAADREHASCRARRPTACRRTDGSRTKTTVPLRRVDLVAVEREGRVARDDDVGLLVAERLLGVLLDDVLAGVRRVYALIPNASMPSVRRSGFQRTPAAGIGSISSRRRTE